MLTYNDLACQVWTRKSCSVIFCTGTYFREIVETESLLELSEEFRLHPGFAMKVIKLPGDVDPE